MKFAPVVLGICASLLSLSAIAHPDEHEYDTKPLAAKCADLGYPNKYEIDAAYPQVKALIATCAAAKKAEAQKAAKHHHHATARQKTAAQKAAAHKARHQTAAQKAAAQKLAARKAAARKAAAKKAAAKA